MAQLNQEARHVVKVTNGASNVTGLVQGNFTLALKSQSSSTFVAASETLTLTEIDSSGLPGLYWIYYTPTAAIGLYRLTVSHATYTVTPSSFEDQVETGYAAGSGPYLTSKANVIASFPTLAATEYDDILDQLIPQVTDYVHAFCGHRFDRSTETKYMDAQGCSASTLTLDRFPVQSITSVHVSLGLPRVWNATTLLDPDTDYTVDLTAGIVHRMNGYWPHFERYGFGSVKIVVDSGPAVVPGHIERAVIETIAVKAMKSRHNEYHVTSKQVGPESIDNIKWDDVPPHAKEVFEMERARQ